jgi:hypothetical protein
MMVALCVVDNCKKLAFKIARDFKLDKFLMKNIVEVNGITPSIDIDERLCVHLSKCH